MVTAEYMVVKDDMLANSPSPLEMTQQPRSWWIIQEPTFLVLEGSWVRRFVVFEFTLKSQFRRFLLLLET